MIDATGPFMRGGVGAAFVAFSSYATVFLFAQDITPIVGARVSFAVFQDRYWFGIILALGFFLGEIFAAERYPRLYRAILIPDTIYTARQLYDGFHAALKVLADTQTNLLFILGLAAGIVLLVAYGAGFPLKLWIVAAGVGCAIIYCTAIAWMLEIAVFVLACLLAIYFGYIVARFGEALLFGKRRTSLAKGG